MTTPAADLQELAKRPPLDALHPHGRVPRSASCRSSSAATAATSRTRTASATSTRLAGLFCVNIGYGFGEEIGQAALEQMRELPFYTNWSYAHPRAIELAAEVASLAPGDLNRVFFCSGGSEAVESAWKLARQFYLARGEKQVHAARASRDPARRLIAALRTPPRRTRRSPGTSRTTGPRSGALSLNGISAIRMPFEPLVPEVRHVRNTNRYHRPPDETEEEFTSFLLDDLEQAIVAMGPETVCLVHMEPVQNAGGCFTPPARLLAGRPRDLRPLRHPAVRRRGDHRLRPARLLVRLGALRHPAGHRHLREGLCPRPMPRSAR